MPIESTAMSKLVRSLLALALAAPLHGCTGARFVAQAARGQWSLTQGVPLEQAMAAPETSPRTRRFLEEALRIKSYAAAHGLNVADNYNEFVQLDREYVVYFVNASDALSFTPRAFWFPIVGSFPGLAWFSPDDAREFAEALRAEGLDVNTRGVSAFSTGGWFADPIVSSMFYDHPAALAFLANTLIHESVHATLLIADQQYFNESMAAYVGDTATPDYLARYHQDDPDLTTAYQEAIKLGRQRTDAMVAAYIKLNNLYLSFRSDEQKLARKATILEQLRQSLALEETPNNATLIGYQLYREGSYEFDQLYAACGRSWPQFLQSLSQLRSADFDQPQTSNIGPPVLRLARRGCPPPPVPPALHSKQYRRHKRKAAGRAQPP